MDIGNKIRKKREELGMTQDELAKKLGYKSRSSVNKVENSREIPMKKVKLYANALDLSVPFLMGWEKEVSFDKLEIDNSYSSEEEALDENLVNMKKRMKEYALKLADLPIDKQEHIMQLIDMLSKDK